jgi:type I restriction enzyme S subunit
MNETLEAIARALFKSWFVDFDPIRAKSEGRDPGLAPHIGDLFPDSFEDSALGKIPRGWRVGRYGDVVDQARDQENPLSSPDALFHHFSIPAFDEGRSPRLEFGAGIKSQKTRVPTGVVLLSKLNPEIERVWIVDVRQGERAVCSTEFLVLRALSPFTRGYVYCLARSPLFRRQIEGLVTGTSKSHQRAHVDSILDLEVVVPPSSIAAAFGQSADTILARTLECRRESRTLAALRDALLPKLIAGELRLKDTERFATGVGP